MRIEYMEFSDSVLVFPPDRANRQLLLDVLQFLDAREESAHNAQVLRYFIEKLEFELQDGLQ